MKNCNTCKFCVFIENEISPGGVMSVNNYQCQNQESPNNNTVMNSISSQMGLIDSRKNNGCDKHQ